MFNVYYVSLNLVLYHRHCETIMFNVDHVFKNKNKNKKNFIVHLRHIVWAVANIHQWTYIDSNDKVIMKKKNHISLQKFNRKW